MPLCAPQSEIATNLCDPGTYYVVVDGNTITEKGPFTLTIIEDSSVAFIADVNATDVSCNGGTDGSAIVNVSGGTAPYDIDWSTSQSVSGMTADTVTNLAPGNYSVSATDAQNCVKVVNFTIIEPASLSLSANGVSPTCFAGTDGEIHVLSPTGGTPPYQYNINGGAFQPSVIFSGIAAGSYTVWIYDANNCNTTTAVTVTDPPAIQPNLTYTDVTCAGFSDGTITPSPTGGTGPYNCSLDGSPVFIPCATFTNLAQGLHTITVRDADGCESSAGVTIGVAPALTILLDSIIAVSCGGYSDGGFAVIAAGGTPPLQYSIDNFTTSQASPGFFNIPAGTYTVQVRDSNSCDNNMNVTVIEPAELVNALLFQVNPSCNGDNDGFAVFLASGGTGPYQYSRDNGPFMPSGAFNNLPAGAYQVVALDNNGCLDTTTATIVDPLPLSVSVASQTVASCLGINDGSVDLSGSGGTWPYEYSLNGGPLQSNPTFNNLAPGNYTTLIEDNNGCTGTGSFTLNANVSITAQVTNWVDVLCFGDLTGSVTLGASNGTAPYQYSDDGATYQGSSTFSNLAAGNYSFTVQDANSCEAVVTHTVNEPAELLPGIVSITDATCGNTLDGAADISISGGVSPYTFTWSNGAVTEDISGVSGGSYSVTITDVNNCQAVQSLTIVQPAPTFINIASFGDVNCSGGADGFIDITVFGGTPAFTFAWSNGAATEDVSSLPGGSYTVTVTEANGCTLTETQTIAEPGPMSTSVVGTNASCNGASDGAADLTVNGGTPPYTYFWSNFQFTEDISGLAAGQYVIIVTDANGCTISDNVTITEPATSMTLSIANTDISCSGANDGELTVSTTGGSGPYTYNWSSGQNTATITNLGPGSYSVTATDANGCTATLAGVVSEPGLLDISISIVNVTCFGGDNGFAIPIISGGTPPYTYAWNTTPAQNTAVPVGLSAGSYSLTVTDAGGCQEVNSITVDEPTEISVSLNSSGVTCVTSADGTVTISATGGSAPYTYSLEGGGFSADSVFSGLTAGTYGVAAIDAENCYGYGTFTLQEPSEVQITMLDRIILVAGAEVVLDPVVTPASSVTSYNWTPATGLSCTDCSNPTASPTQTTVYTLAITDLDGCQVLATVEVFIKTDPEIFIPNAFSPNNDTRNDIFEIKDFGSIGALEFYVFNKWGEKLYQTSEVGFKWDGTYKGSALEPGPYVYYLKATLINGLEKEHFGTITIVK